MTQGQKIFNKNKVWIEQARVNKKQKDQELLEAGLGNTPEAHVMPQLTYKYLMNEPFVGGTASQIQNSHEQFKYKRAKTLGIEMDEGTDIKSKTEEQFRSEQTSFWNNVESNPTEDIQTFMIKQDSEELFGLSISARQSYNM